MSSKLTGLDGLLKLLLRLRRDSGCFWGVTALAGSTGFASWLAPWRASRPRESAAPSRILGTVMPDLVHTW